MSGTGGPLSTATYMLPPMTATVDVDALEAWIGDPESDDSILIAEGRVAPKMALAWIMAQQWREAGLIAIAARPSEKIVDGRRDTCWVASKLARPAPLSGGTGRVARRDGRAAEPLAPDDTPVSDNILRAIKRAANMGQAAPSLAVLAAGSGLKTASNADYYVRKLAQRGLIEIDSKRFATGSRRRYRVLDERGVVTRQTDWGQ